MKSKIAALTEELRKHNPFSNKKRLGPGPKGETLVRKKKWSCSGSNYLYTCKGIAKETKGRIIRLKVKPENKQVYNYLYKKWLIK